MGGNGGYGFGRASALSERNQNLAQSLQRTRQQAEATELAQIFSQTMERINQLDTEALGKHKETVLRALNSLFEGGYDLRGGGSRTRHTYVNGLSDVDFLLDLGPYSTSSIADKDNSAAVLQAMVGQLQQRMPNTQLKAGRMAVTVQFSDGQELQILPAFRYHSGYRVPDAQGLGWVVTKPHVFAKMLSDRNAAVGSKLLRTIKLSKLLCENFAVGIKSYHLENVALKAFQQYTGPHNDVEMLRHLFNQAKQFVTRPMPDITGQSTHVDKYLSDNNERVGLARQLAAVEREIGKAGADPDLWRSLLRDQRQ